MANKNLQPYKPVDVSFLGEQKVFLPLSFHFVFTNSQISARESTGTNMMYPFHRCKHSNLAHT
jgi:hypothetical protein